MNPIQKLASQAAKADNKHIKGKSPLSSLPSAQTIVDRATNLYDRYFGGPRGPILTPGVEYKIDVPHINAKMLYNTVKNPYRHRWCITMERYGVYSLDNPYSMIGFPLNILPVTQFRLDTYKIKEDTIDLTSGYDITVPVGYEFNKSLSLTIYNDVVEGVNLLRTWLRAYRQRIFPGYKTTVPYKMACMKFTIYIYDSMYKDMDTYEYYGIPDVSDPSIASEESNDRSYTISIFLLGESNNNPNLPVNAGVGTSYNLSNPVVPATPLTKLQKAIGIGKSLLSGNNEYVKDFQGMVNYFTADALSW